MTITKLPNRITAPVLLEALEKLDRALGAARCELERENRTEWTKDLESAALEVTAFAYQLGLIAPDLETEPLYEDETGFTCCEAHGFVRYAEREEASR